MPDAPRPVTSDGRAAGAAAPHRGARPSSPRPGAPVGVHLVQNTGEEFLVELGVFTQAGSPTQNTAVE